jgi:hypothetical protein
LVKTKYAVVDAPEMDGELQIVLRAIHARTLRNGSQPVKFVAVKTYFDGSAVDSVQ